jgi:hypothetical protein
MQRARDPVAAFIKRKKPQIGTASQRGAHFQRPALQSLFTFPLLLGRISWCVEEVSSPPIRLFQIKVTRAAKIPPGAAPREDAKTWRTAAKRGKLVVRVLIVAVTLAYTLTRRIRS